MRHRLAFYLNSLTTKSILFILNEFDPTWKNNGNKLRGKNHTTITKYLWGETKQSTLRWNKLHSTIKVFDVNFPRKLTKYELRKNLIVTPYLKKKVQLLIPYLLLIDHSKFTVHCGDDLSDSKAGDSNYRPVNSLNFFVNKFPRQ